LVISLILVIQNFSGSIITDQLLGRATRIMAKNVDTELVRYLIPLEKKLYQ